MAASHVLVETNAPVVPKILISYKIINACYAQESLIVAPNVQTETLAPNAFLTFCQAKGNVKFAVSGCLIVKPVKIISKDAMFAVKVTTFNKEMEPVLLAPRLILIAKNAVMVLNVPNAVLVSL